MALPEISFDYADFVDLADWICGGSSRRLIGGGIGVSGAGEFCGRHNFWENYGVADWMLVDLLESASSEAREHIR